MAQKETTQKSFREHMEVIVRRRRFLLIPMIGIFLLSVILSFVLPKKYKATAYIQITDQRIIQPLLNEGDDPGSADAQVKALSRQLLSFPYLLSMIKQLDLVNSTVGESEVEGFIQEFKKRIALESKEKDVIEVSFEDGNPATAQRVVNAIARSFITENLRNKKEQAQGTIEFIGDQLNIYRKKLEQSERTFSFRKIDEQIQELENKRQMLQSQLSNTGKAKPSVATSANPAVGRMQTHLAELEMELSRLLMDATEEHPRVLALREEIRRIKESLEQEIRKDTTRGAVVSSDPQYAGQQQELRQVEAEIERLQARKKEMASADGQNAAVPDDQLAAAETGRKVDEDIYQMLLKQIENAYVFERLQDSEKSGPLRVLEYARLPGRPVKPEAAKLLAMGAFLGVFAGLGLVFLMEYLDRSFRTADEAKRQLKMQFLGSVSKIVLEQNRAQTWTTRFNDRIKRFLQKHKVFADIRFVSPHIARRVTDSGLSPQVVIHHEPKSPVSEEYRILRTNVQGLGYESPMQVLVVTSTVRGEGKSTTSSNLAVSMADSGKNVLIIDCDLRRGSTHELLNLRQMPGLADVLGKRIEAEKALVKTAVRNLTALPCGDRPMNPSELLGLPEMERLIERMRERFDMIVMDAPPVLNLPDAAVLGKYADGVLFVVQAERTQREDVQQAYARLVQAHSNVAGFILTNVQYYIPKYVYDYLYGT